MKKIVSIFAIGSSLLYGYEFHPLGYESIGMGGAGVSNAKGSMAGYYNPALLSKSRYTFEMSSQFGIGTKESNLAEHADALSGIDFTETVDRVTSVSNAFDGLVLGVYNETDKENLKTAVDILKNIYVQNNLTILPTASFAIQYKNFQIASYSSTSASAQMIIDSNALELYAPYGSNGYVHYDPYADDNPYSTISLTQEEYESTSLAYALENGKTYIDLKGVSLVELPISYAENFDTGYGALSLGASLKYMGVGVYSDKVNIDTKAEDLADQFSDTSKSSSNFGVDVGLLYQPKEYITLGLVAKNINSPEFDNIANEEAIEIAPMIRAGMTLSLWDSIDLAVDYDLTENETALAHDKSQYIGGGINFRPTSWLSFRAGMMNNVVYDDSPYIYTAGVGFGLKWFQLDIAAQVSDNLTMVDGTEITDYAKVNFAMIMRWGDESQKNLPIQENNHQNMDENNKNSILSQEKKQAIQEKAKKAHQELDSSN
jgi:hypothetical protein